MTVTLASDSGYDDESVYVIHQISGGDYEGVNAGFVFIKVLDPKPAVELSHTAIHLREGDTFRTR